MLTARRLPTALLFCQLAAAQGVIAIYPSPTSVEKATTRQFSNQPAAELAAKLASLAPGDLDYTLYAVSGAEANERSIQIARHYWLAAGRPRKYKIIALQGGYHGGTIATFGFGGSAEQIRAYEPYRWSGFTRVAAPYPFRDRGNGTARTETAFMRAASAGRCACPTPRPRGRMPRGS